jgi:hypothetical protein
VTRQNDYYHPDGTIEEILRIGLEVVPGMIRVLFNNIMQAKRF